MSGEAPQTGADGLHVAFLKLLNPQVTQYAVPSAQSILE